MLCRIDKGAGYMEFDILRAFISSIREDEEEQYGAMR